MIRRKTGVYLAEDHATGSIDRKDAPQDIFEKVGDFGEALGIGFQIKDDLLNLEEEAGESRIWKGTRWRHQEGKRTLITIHMLEKLGHPDAKRLKRILLNLQRKLTIKMLSGY